MKKKMSCCYKHGNHTWGHNQFLDGFLLNGCACLSVYVCVLLGCVLFFFFFYFGIVLANFCISFCPVCFFFLGGGCGFILFLRFSVVDVKLHAFLKLHTVADFALPQACLNMSLHIRTYRQVTITIIADLCYYCII